MLEKDEFIERIEQRVIVIELLAVGARKVTPDNYVG